MAFSANLATLLMTMRRHCHTAQCNIVAQCKCSCAHEVKASCKKCRCNHKHSHASNEKEIHHLFESEKHHCIYYDCYLVITRMKTRSNAAIFNSIRLNDTNKEGMSLSALELDEKSNICNNNDLSIHNEITKGIVLDSANKRGVMRKRH